MSRGWWWKFTQYESVDLISEPCYSSKDSKNKHLVRLLILNHNFLICAIHNHTVLNQCFTQLVIGIMRQNMIERLTVASLVFISPLWEFTEWEFTEYRVLVWRSSKTSIKSSPNSIFFVLSYRNSHDF